jgi:hypothetical protein
MLLGWTAFRRRGLAATPALAPDGLRLLLLDHTSISQRDLLAAESDMKLGRATAVETP